MKVGTEIQNDCHKMETVDCGGAEVSNEDVLFSEVHQRNRPGENLRRSYLPSS